MKRHIVIGIRILFAVQLIITGVAAQPPGGGPLPAGAEYIRNVPDYSQPPTYTMQCPIGSYCAPVATMNVTAYWDSVMSYANALNVNPVPNMLTSAEYVGFFMATNGNTDSACGSRNRMNFNKPGTFTGDIGPGILEYARWDSTHRSTWEPKAGLSAAKKGYDWDATLDTSQGFAFLKQEIDGGRPVVVSFNYWNPIHGGDHYVDSVNGDPIEIFTQGPPVTSSAQSSMPPAGGVEEEWPCADAEPPCPRAKAIGHAVTGVGYIPYYDPDGSAGPLPQAEWIICHDNWNSTPPGIMINWTQWQATIAIDPSLPTEARRSFRSAGRPIRHACILSGYEGHVRIIAYTVAGRKLGSYTYSFTRGIKPDFAEILHDVGTAVYYCRIEADDYATVRKQIVFR
jgi:hypothetical protein